MSAANVQYRVTTQQGGHRFQVTIELAVSERQQLSFSLPVWIAGSYTRRDFAKNVYALHAVNEKGDNIAIAQCSPSRWQVDVNACKKLIIGYQYYARDYSVRGCYVDDERLMFNPGCALMMLEGLEKVPLSLCLQLDASRAEWALSHPDFSDAEAVIFPDYETLADTPLIAAKKLHRIALPVGDVPHEIVICGTATKALPSYFADDITKICQEARAMFGRFPQKMTHYRFLLFVTENTGGGLEHQNSSMLMAPRRFKPSALNNRQSDNYIRLLGLFSHEYFHSWNIKSMRPVTYAQGYDLTQEQPNTMLWLFEGFTAYFDNLLLMRSGVITKEAYLTLLGHDIAYDLQRPGWRYQTLTQSSLEAWTKLYNGGENAVNTSTTYYVRGALAAWCMDMFIRQRSDNQASLRSVMQALWLAQQETPTGVDEACFTAAVLAQLPADAHADFTALLARLLHSTLAQPLEAAAAAVGMEIAYLAPVSATDMGTQAPIEKRATTEAGFRWEVRDGHFYVTKLNPDSAAALAGLAMGDEPISVGGERVTEENLWRILCCNRLNKRVKVTILRDGRVKRYAWKSEAAVQQTCLLRFLASAAPQALAQRRKWCNDNLESVHG